MNKIIWRDMTREELDAAYNNSAAVQNSAEKTADYAERSARFRAKNNGLLDLAYGPKPRNRIDIFRSNAKNAPLFVFIHGGYWLRNSKETFACTAEGPLAPDATLTEIAEEIRSAMRFLRAEGPKLGVGQNGVILSGWSAGGHLTMMALEHADAGLPISGIFDVEPCRLNYVNETLRMTPEEAIAMSPIRHLGKQNKPLIIAYGLGERPEFQRQPQEYHSAREAAGMASELLPLEGHDHFSILEELADPKGKLALAVKHLADAVRKTNE